MLLGKITIIGEVMSKKNSKRIAKKRLISSKQYQDYEKSASIQVSMKRPIQSPTWPIKIHFFFHRKTRRSFDYNNMAQGPQDILVKAGIIPDDSMQYVIPVFHSEYAGWCVDKHNPRLEMTFESIESP